VAAKIEKRALQEEPERDRDEIKAARTKDAISQCGQRVPHRTGVTERRKEDELSIHESE
jgi:hypothetical protein